MFRVVAQWKCGSVNMILAGARVLFAGCATGPSGIPKDDGRSGLEKKKVEVHMTRGRLPVLVVMVLGAAICCGAREAGFGEVERQFRELPMEARRLTGPLFWLHGDESRELLERYVGKVAEGGNGTFTAESRPHSDWLGEGWYRDLGICLEAAKRHNLSMWIFDEKWWPSGEVGGKVPPRYGCKRLVLATESFSGPGRFERAGYGGPNFVAAVAGRQKEDGIEGASLADLSGSIKDGRLEWRAPAGEWKVMKFTWKPSGGRIVVDGASRDCVDWYIQTVYQPHYERFKEDFGKTIAGYFYDEPETHGDWGTEVFKVLDERGVDWKKALVAWKFGLAGDEQAAGKYQYRDALAEAWGRTLYGGLSRWCRERGVLSIGHFLEHRNGYLNLDLCAGNVFQLMKYSDMGGIDAVFSQFVWGKRVTRGAPVWQTPKIASSVTHVYGKPDDVTMVEIFGARGQDLTYPEMKWWTDHMHASGVNFMIPHSFNPRSPHDTDCPPYFYNGGFEARWPLYRVFADYTSRLSVMLTGGRHVAPVALLFAGNSYHVGKTVTPEHMSEVLQDALYDCDWLPYDVFEDAGELAGREIRLYRESYRVLIVPPVEVIPYGTLAKAKRFFDGGGVVVGHGFLPTKSAALGRTSADIAQLREAVWGDAKPGLGPCKINDEGGRSYLLPERPTVEQLQQVLAGDAGVVPTLEVVEGRTENWLHVLHRVKSGRDVFFVTNQNHLGNARRFRFRITADGEPECWDAMRNEITAVQYRRTGEHTFEVDLALEPSESVLLVFQPERRRLPMRLTGAEKGAAKTLAIVRESVIAAKKPEPQIEGQQGKLSLEGCSWVWYPEGNPAESAPAEARYFRKRIMIGAGRRIKKATFVGTADNSFALFVNGGSTSDSDAGNTEWSNPVKLDMTERLKVGANQLAIKAVNATNQPNPAGLIGRYVIEFEAGPTMTGRIDENWKASRREKAGWQDPDFDDRNWVTARKVAPYGGGPWGVLGGRRRLTLSGVKADPFYGRCEIPAGVRLARSRVYLELDELAPEEAARVTVNGKYAGGFIGRPLRLDVTKYLKTGTNTILIEPFAPKLARLIIYE